MNSRFRKRKTTNNCALSVTVQAVSLIVRRLFCNHMAMFNIHIASVYGFCKGVEASVRTAEKMIGEAGGRPIYSIGRLVHNNRVVDDFSSRGLRVISSPDEVGPGLALIRAHGITRELKKEFEDKGFTLVDGTCRIVAANHRTCASAVNPVLFFGIKGHAETLSTTSNCNTRCYVIENSSDFDLVEPSEYYDVVIQTTFSSVKIEEFKAIIKERGMKVRYHNSICAASMRRRSSVEELCRICDTIIVVGESQSANASELYNIVVSHGVKGYLVPGAEYLEEEMYAGNDIGVCAGASVYPKDVRNLVSALEQRGGVIAQSR